LPGLGPIRVKYAPGALDLGAPPNYWQYDASGRLYAIPGYIASIDYEADGQTRKITYANG
jgi:hypothetical protein